MEVVGTSNLVALCRCARSLVQNLVLRDLAILGRDLESASVLRSWVYGRMSNCRDTMDVLLRMSAC